MLTVKLTKESPSTETGRFSTKIVEASEVNLHILDPGALIEISGNTPTDPQGFAYYLVPRKAPRPKDFAPEVDLWFEAYIENEQGSTIHTIRF